MEQVWGVTKGHEDTFGEDEDVLFYCGDVFTNVCIYENLANLDFQYVICHLHLSKAVNKQTTRLKPTFSGAKDTCPWRRGTWPTCHTATPALGNTVPLSSSFSSALTNAFDAWMCLTSGQPVKILQGGLLATYWTQGQCSHNSLRHWTTTER